MPSRVGGDRGHSSEEESPMSRTFPVLIAALTTCGFVDDQPRSTAGVSRCGRIIRTDPALPVERGRGRGGQSRIAWLGFRWNVQRRAGARRMETSGGDAGVTFTGVADFIESLSAAPSFLTGNPTFSIETVVRIPSDAASVLYPPFLHWGAAGTMNSVYFSLLSSGVATVSTPVSTTAGCAMSVSFRMISGCTS